MGLARAFLHGLAALPLLCAGGAAWAQDASAYDRCMADAAMKASYTGTAPTDIYAIARGNCADIRAALTNAQPGLTAALDTADAQRAKTFPAWIKGVRERRREREMQGGKP